MRRKLLFFINPVSGTASKANLERKIIRKCAEYGGRYEFMSTTATGEYPHLADKVIQDRVTDIVICGGDGSLSPLISTMLGMKVNFGIVPLGSGNGLALAANIPLTIERALDIVFTGKPAATDAFLVNKRLSCMLSGIGFDAQVAYDFSIQKKRGLNTYILQTLKNFVAANAFPFQISVGGNHFETNAFFICVANSNQFGNNFTIAPEASLSDGLLDIIIVKKMTKMKLLWSVIQQVNEGRLTKDVESEFYSKSVIYLQVNALKIKNASMAPLHIDGDPAPTSDLLDIRIIPEAFRLIRPQ